MRIQIVGVQEIEPNGICPNKCLQIHLLILILTTRIVAMDQPLVKRGLIIVPTKGRAVKVKMTVR